MCCCFFFFKQKTAYEMRISDWSSDVCSSDLRTDLPASAGLQPVDHRLHRLDVGIFELQVGQIREMIALMLVGAGLDRADRAQATEQRIDRRRTHAARRAAPHHPHRSDLVPATLAAERPPDTGRGHALGELTD